MHHKTYKPPPAKHTSMNHIDSRHTILSCSFEIGIHLSVRRTMYLCQNAATRMKRIYSIDSMDHSHAILSYSFVLDIHLSVMRIMYLCQNAAKRLTDAVACSDP